MGCQKWLPLCAPIFLTYFWRSRQCALNELNMDFFWSFGWLFQDVANALGYKTNGSDNLWKDRANVELTSAVLDSYKKAGVTIVDHHTLVRDFYPIQNVWKSGTTNLGCVFLLILTNIHLLFYIYLKSKASNKYLPFSTSRNFMSLPLWIGCLKNSLTYMSLIFF